MATATRDTSASTTEKRVGPAPLPDAAKRRRRAPFFVELYRSAVGKKYVMAITGIAIMGFVLAHMVGNLKMYLGIAEFDTYGDFLREILVPILPRTVFLWLLRGGLIAAFALHIHAAYALTIMNRRARRTNYHSKRDYIAANYASRTMRVSGIIVGLYIVFHLFDLSWTGTGATYVRGDPYGNVVHSLSRWPVALLYIVANIALGFHLFHGAWSLFQSMGWNNPRFNRWRRNFAIGFTGFVVVANVSFPVMILAGVVST